jgi:hypothetical protein
MPELVELVGILRGVRWAVVGAVAASRYMPARATRDLVIAVLPQDHDEVARRLVEAGYRRTGNLSIGGSSWSALDGTPIDVLAGTERWWPNALESTSLDAGGVPFLAARYLVLMKLLASRVQDLADVTRILGSMGETELDAVRTVIRSEAAALADDLESLIALGQLEQQA